MNGITSIGDSVILLLGLLTAVVPLSCVWTQEAQAEAPKKVIYETDMCLDVDDVGALAMLNALADKGEVEILAVCFNEVHDSGAATIDAINTWYGRGSIPIGVYKGKLDSPDGSGYLSHVAEFAHELTNETAPDALDVYLKVLRKQPDRSVTIISVGFLNNIYDLLRADPGLIDRKVVELVVMGGLNGDDFNLVRHGLVEKTQFVIQTWPTPLIVSDFGGGTLTGARLSTAPAANPVREAYYRWFGDRYDGRCSWDQVAALYGVRGFGGCFYEISEGSGSLANGFKWELKPGFRTYLGVKLTDAEMAEIVEDLMVAAPKLLESSDTGGNDGK